MSLGLARLALRRALPLGLVALALVLAVAFLATSWRPDGLQAAALSGSMDPASAASVLARQGLWTTLLATLAPFLLVRAATMLPAWRRGEVDWLFASARRRGGLVVSAFLGLFAAACLLVLFVTVAAELAAGPATHGQALVARFATPVLVVDVKEPVVRRVDPGSAAPGGVLRVSFLLVGGGRSAALRLAVRSLSDDGGSSAVLARLASPGAVEVPLPSPQGPYELTLERMEGDALVAVRTDGIELVVPTSTARAASARIAARAGLALAAALAVALGLGAWLGAPTAALGALVVPFAAVLADGAAARLLPPAALRDALTLAGEGLAAPWPSLRALAATALIVALGLLLATAGLHRWRLAP